MPTFDTVLQILVDGEVVNVKDSISIPQKGIDIDADGIRWIISVRKPKKEEEQK